MQVSLLIPDRFQERYVRVYVRSHDDDDMLKATREVVLSFLN